MFDSPAFAAAEKVKLMTKVQEKTTINFKYIFLEAIYLKNVIMNVININGWIGSQIRCSVVKAVQFINQALNILQMQI